VSGQDQVTVFKQSKEISPYLFAIVAGPYTYVESKKHEEGLPPLRVYLRKSVIKTIQPEVLDEMLMTTLVGMRFYKDLFGIQYQFNKYDQIFVPEFNMGAMENVACVTFSEATLRRGQTMTLNEQLTLTNTILHELAHQWFGNLVTMKWWNDLWLNESFATYMSYLVMTQAPELNKYKGAWIDFMGRKFQGIDADILQTTHPVVNNIKSVSEAESVFNGISYGKGASFLKQANKVLGQDTLKKALHIYFQKHKWTNTEFPDFIGALQQAYDAKNDTSMGKKFKFNEWCDQWLKNSGVNTLEPLVTYGAGNSLT
jgi:aminopeptidase N